MVGVFCHEPHCIYPFVVACTVSPIPCDVGEAVFARCLSSLKHERVESSRILKGPQAARYAGNRKQMVDDIKLVRIN